MYVATLGLEAQYGEIRIPQQNGKPADASPIGRTDGRQHFDLSAGARSLRADQWLQDIGVLCFRQAAEMHDTQKDMNTPFRIPGIGFASGTILAQYMFCFQ